MSVDWLCTAEKPRWSKRYDQYRDIGVTIALKRSVARTSFDIQEINDPPLPHTSIDLDNLPQ